MIVENITRTTKNFDEFDVWDSLIYQLVWSLLESLVDDGSVLSEAGSCNSFSPKE